MYCTNIYSKATIYVSELILTPVSAFDIKYKKCNAKNLRKCIFTASSRVSFAYFPKTALGHGWCPPSIPFRIFVDYVTMSNWNPMQYLRCSFLWQKIRNSWKLLLTVVKENFTLNVTGLIYPTLKHKDKFRLRQLSIPSGIYMFKLSKKNTRNVLNIFLISSKHIRMVSLASIINFEHILHFILLFLSLHLSK